MALLRVEGIDKDGGIELSERPRRVESPPRMFVTYLPSEAHAGGAVDRQTPRLRASSRMKEGMHPGDFP